jgi:ABC-type transporter Mla maintaining outer membrane lipid asymmetry ATPase subunit MlaF
VATDDETACKQCKDIGVLFQSGALFGSMTLWKCLLPLKNMTLAGKPLTESYEIEHGQPDGFKTPPVGTSGRNEKKGLARARPRPNCPFDDRPRTRPGRLPNWTFYEQVNSGLEPPLV